MAPASPNTGINWYLFWLAVLALSVVAIAVVQVLAYTGN